MAFFRNALYGAFVLILVGCGSSPKSHSPSSGDDSSGTTTAGPTHGENAYDGFMTVSGDEMENWDPPYPPTFDFPNVALIDIWEPNENWGDYLVYRPTCLSGSQVESYSMVSVNGGTMNTITITRTANSISKQYYLVKDGVARMYAPPEDVASGTCENGRFEISGEPVLYANGTVAVLNDGGNNVYFGIRDSNLITWGTVNATGTSFTWVHEDAEKWDDNTVWGTTAGQIDPSASIVGGIANFGGIASTITQIPDIGTAFPMAHIHLVNAGGSSRGIIGNIGGKKLVIGVREKDGAGGFNAGNADCYNHWIDPAYKQCYGVGALYIFSSQ